MSTVHKPFASTFRSLWVLRGAIKIRQEKGLLLREIAAELRVPLSVIHDAVLDELRKG